MKSVSILLFVFLYVYTTHSAILKTPMVNNYAQIAVLGCDSNKANLYYDIDRQVWVEHLISSCVNNEQDILEFCKNAYPSLQIGNIVRLDTVVGFDNWCELLPPIDNSGIPRCNKNIQAEELVQPYRCLTTNSTHEELSLPNIDCTMNSIKETGECLRSEKWQQIASLRCSNKTMVLSKSLMTPDWCGLSEFRGIEFVCCPLKDNDANNDYNTLSEDDPVQEPVIEPQKNLLASNRKIIATSYASYQPSWFEDSRQWNLMNGYFSDDEDVDDDDEDIKLSSTRKSHLTVNEHERFTKDKEKFKQKYKKQIDELRSSWQNKQNELQSLATMNPYKAQEEFEASDLQFRQEYDNIKQEANRERTRINELHEKNLDSLLNIAKNETSQKLDAAWNEKPLKVNNIDDALYNYLHVLLRDRIHLVNRYERLRVVDPDQAKFKRVSIHERLRSIANLINNALNKLRNNLEIQSKIQPRINSLIDEYDEVNKAAEKLLLDYTASLSTTVVPSTKRLLPLGRDEKKIYPFPKKQPNKVNSDEYDSVPTDDDYDTDDDDDDNNDDKTTAATTTEANIDDKEQVDISDSGWNVEDRVGPIFNVKADFKSREPLIDNIRPLMPMNNDKERPVRFNSFVAVLPYIVGFLVIICVIFTVFIIRYIIQQRRNYQYGNNYEKQYAFKEIDSCTPEERALHALQMNGYENPTYKFFENQTPKC